jgi:hypothetical protein
MNTMGEPDDDPYTSQQRACIKKMRALPTPEQRAAALQKKCELDKGLKLIDRASAIRDGLISPPWAEKLLKTATAPKAKSKKVDAVETEKVEPKKERHTFWKDPVDRVLRENFPHGEEFFAQGRREKGSRSPRSPDQAIRSQAANAGPDLPQKRSLAKLTEKRLHGCKPTAPVQSVHFAFLRCGLMIPLIFR